MTTILEVKDLCKTYVLNKRQNNVLKNVNFHIDEGEMTAVMGPSGSGKSTLLYAVSGMDTITAGEVKFCGKSIGEMDQKELAAFRLDEMGFIFQQMYMLKNLSVLDNIILPACQSRKQKEKRRETVERGHELMRRLGIIDVADNDINEVSGGQLQRACICRSMINRPKMIFADVKWSMVLIVYCVYSVQKKRKRERYTQINPRFVYSVINISESRSRWKGMIRKPFFIAPNSQSDAGCL